MSWKLSDKDFKNGFVAAFQYAVKVMPYYWHESFFEICKSYDLCPSGLNIRKKPFIEFESDNLIILWKNTLLSAENDLLEALCVGICDWIFNILKIRIFKIRTNKKLSLAKLHKE